MSQETEGMKKYLVDLKTDDLLLKFSWASPRGSWDQTDRTFFVSR